MTKIIKKNRSINCIKVALNFAFVLSLLPLNVKLSLSSFVAKKLYSRINKRRRIINKNLSACFPELNEDQRFELGRAAFISYINGIIESCHSWWRPIDGVLDDMIVTGQDNLDEAMKGDGGVLLMAGHFSVLDLAIPMVASIVPKLGYMYKPNKNKYLNHVIEVGRKKHFPVRSFNQSQFKDLLQFLNEGGVLICAADQDFRKKSKTFAKFFGVEAACITSPSLITRRAGAKVLFVSQFRHPCGKYEVCFSPVFNDFGNDEAQDAQTWNSQLEHEIRKHPEQYWWSYKRFRTRPHGGEKFYT